MSLRSSVVVDKDTITNEIQSLLSELGVGRVEGVAYDTAWVGRLAPRYPGYGFEQSLEWLRRNQYDDGTWGAPLIHYHDRFISTLAAIVALREAGSDPADPQRVTRGEDALWRLVGKLGRDDSDTVGFPIISVALATEAAAFDLDVPLPPVRFAAPYQKKVQALIGQSVRDWRTSSLTFSFEALRDTLGDNDTILTSNHSVSGSPSATAAYLMSKTDDNGLSYLKSIAEWEGNGAIPAASPIDVFETAWAINHLSHAGAIQPEMPQVRRALDHLWSVWSEETGVSFSYNANIHDLDDTAAAFLALRWGKYPVSSDVFGYYEMPDHFATYLNETNPSLSAHVRLLKALRVSEDDDRKVKWIEKTAKALVILDENGSFWWDKWHSSPYYVTGASLSALHGIHDDLAYSRLKWILRTQNQDGGWGYLGTSTAEETAYCLEGLLYWHRAVSPVEQSVLAAAANFLYAHMNVQRYTPLYIIKTLFTPHNVVKAVILSSLFSYENL